MVADAMLCAWHRHLSAATYRMAEVLEASELPGSDSWLGFLQANVGVARGNAPASARTPRTRILPAASAE